MNLQICGNSSHLAPWHAKLGFQKDPFVTTLGSLDPHGGLVPSLHVEVLKVGDFIALRGSVGLRLDRYIP